MTHLDHVIFKSSPPRAAAALRRFASAGFRIHDRTMSRPGGELSHFVLLNDGYLEIIASAGGRSYSELKPVALAFAVVDTGAIAPQIFSAAGARASTRTDLLAIDGGLVPAWGVVQIEACLPLAMDLYAVSYLRPRSIDLRGLASPNGIGTLRGVTYETGLDDSASLRDATGVVRAIAPQVQVAPNRMDVGEQSIRIERSSANKDRMHFRLRLNADDGGRTASCLRSAGFVRETVDFGRMLLREPELDGVRLSIEAV